MNLEKTVKKNWKKELARTTVATMALVMSATAGIYYAGPPAIEYLQRVTNTYIPHEQKLPANESCLK